MTGFGAATLAGEVGEFTAEVKSLNNRFLDISVRLPRELGFLEPDVREEVKRCARRGKIDLFLRWSAAPNAEPLYEINQPLLKHYAGEVRAALSEAGEAPGLVDLRGLLDLPGVVVQTRTASDDSAVTVGALDVVRQALEAMDRTRRQEGRALTEAIETHLDALADARDRIASAKDELVSRYRSQLKERIAALELPGAAPFDPARLEQEVILFADRCEITEELVRIETHIATFREQCRSETGEPVGKFMDFLVQELLRETNTIGNKARGGAIPGRIVQMKSEIEKIREQVQNLE